MALDTMVNVGQKYNDPNQDPSSVGKQFNTAFWLRHSLIEAREEQYFTQLSDVETMPRHYGKEIVAYHYLPILDDRNINDQGIDANGVVIANGNLYGSSRDIGKIIDKMPTLGEEGGRVNRVGSIRIDIKGRIARMGIFREWTDESIIFDTDSELMNHMQRELLTAAFKINEDMVQVELLQAADTIVYAGIATKDEEITGEGANVSEVSYENLTRLDTTLNNLRCPRTTRIITGSAFTDTRVIPPCRVVYVGSDLEPTLRNMKDNFGNPAFIAVEHYAAGAGGANALLRGEIGKVGNFRIISALTMAHWAGKGATVTDQDTLYQHENGKYSIFPMLVVGQGSFSHIGFDAPARGNKFKIRTRLPGQLDGRDDPYGEIGYSSIKWYYGMLPLRPERLAVIKTVARI